MSRKSLLAAGVGADVRRQVIAIAFAGLLAFAGLSGLLSKAQADQPQTSAALATFANGAPVVVSDADGGAGTERDGLVSALAAGTTTRAAVLRAAAEDQTLKDAELRKAFVLMQYFGYLRRNPDGAPDTNFDGYDFWLDKLDQFGGNYEQAEMVRAFISSIEYRPRFGQ